MRHLLKPTILILLVTLFTSCSVEKSKELQDSTPSPIESKIIKGTVTGIVNGKDGYTADVLTEGDGVYAALVSIVNLSASKSYQRFEIGDKVTLEGMPYDLAGKKQLKVEQILDVASTRTQLLITPAAFRGIRVGDEIAKHTDYVQKELLKTGEGDFEVYRIKDFNNNPAGYFLPDPNNEQLVGDITVETQMASTPKGIKVGSTFQELKEALPNVKVHGSEIEGRTYAKARNISYRLDVANFVYEVDMAKIPPTTKVTQIVINRLPTQNK